MTSILSTYLIIFAGLNPVTCPKWLPGTNVPLPAGVTLSPEPELQNRMRCYCQVIKREEAICIRSNTPRSQCVQRTETWIRENLQLFSIDRFNVPSLPRRNLMINVGVGR